MPTETVRSIIDLGQGSVVITLPKAWVRYYGLRPGDKVLVVTNGKLVVKPLKRRSRRGKTEG
ncbi:MAG: AbrB/MazE/SpoVT family DNA-binding domain-containing protein [Chloroflexota bacterium]